MCLGAGQGWVVSVEVNLSPLGVDVSTWALLCTSSCTLSVSTIFTVGTLVVVATVSRTAVNQGPYNRDCKVRHITGFVLCINWRGV